MTARLPRPLSDATDVAPSARGSRGPVSRGRAAWRAVIAVGVAASLCACAQEIRAEDFRTPCANDDDCIPAYSGDACAACTCPTSVISRSEEAAYKEARDWALCPFRDDDVLCDCPIADTACVDAECVVLSD